MTARRRSLWAAFALMILLVCFFLAGPRVPVSTEIVFDPESLGDDLDSYLNQQEAAYGDIRPGLEKSIVWADPAAKSKTAVSVVYIHGFSASSGELRPVPDRVARAFGANLYFARLSGHGRDGPAMMEASVNDWINDAAEAIAIGRRLGDRVIMMGTSTGATLTAWTLTQQALARDVAAIVLVSPNFGVRAAGSGILTVPWGGVIARLILGETRGFRPLNPLHARYWTTSYPTRALLPMAALVDLANTADLQSIEVPALFIQSPDDRVVRTDRIAAAARRWGAPVVIEHFEKSGDPGNHVLAGDALSPQTTAPMTRLIVQFLKPILARHADQASASGRASLENR